MAEQRKSDERLIEEWQADVNREENFRCLFVRHRMQIADFFKKQGFTDEECRDLTQDTFIRVYRGLASFRHTASFRTWLFQIARNLRKNSLRDGQAQKRAGEEVSFEAIAEAKGAVSIQIEQGVIANRELPGPLSQILVEEQFQRLQKVLTELPVVQQRLVLCRVHQELKYREISILMNMPLGTVKSQLARARSFLQEKLGQDYPALRF